MNKLEAFIKILVDGQAYLYAQNMQAMTVAGGDTATEDQLEEWMDEWKKQTAELVEEMMNE